MNGFEMRQNAKIKQYLNRNKLKTHSPLPIDALLQKNQHSLVVMTPAEFWDFVLKYYKRKGQTEEQTALIMLDLLISKGLATLDTKTMWENNKDTVKGLGGLLPSFFDAKKLKALAAEMKRGGSAISSYRIQNYAGGSYIILKGNPRLRHQLTGTRYLANNPKVVSMGLGKLGANNALRGGGIVTVVFSAAFHCMDQLMNDELTWHHFVGGLAADVVIAATASGIIWSGLTFTGVAVAGLAIGPLLAILVVGGLVSYGLSKLFSAQLTSFFVDSLVVAEKYFKQSRGVMQPLQIMTSIIVARNFEDGLLKFQDQIKALRYSAINNLQKANNDPVGYMHKLFHIPDTRDIFK